MSTHITTEVVYKWDITTQSYKKLSEKGASYSGPLSLCGGSSSSSSTTVQSPVDPEAARRMAATLETEQKRLNEMWGMYKDVFQPYDEALVQANTNLISYNEALAKADMEAQANLIPLRADAQAAALRDSMVDIEAMRPIKDMQAQQQLEGMQAASGLDEKFYQESMKDVNIGDRMGAATADVVQGAKQAEGAMIRTAGRMGLDMSSGAFVNALAKGSFEKSKMIGGARTAARRQAENETLAKLGTAMSFKASTAGGLNGNMASAGLTAMPYNQGQTQLGGYSLTNPVNQTIGMAGNIIQGHAAGMSPLTNGSSESSGWSIL